MRRAIEADDGHLVLDVAHQRVEDRIKMLIVGEVVHAGATNFNDHRQSYGLRIRILIEGQTLRNSVVGEKEVVRRELEDDFPFFRRNQRRDDYQVRTDRQG